MSVNMKLAEKSEIKFDIFFFSIIFTKLELIIRQLYKVYMMLYRLYAFFTLLYNIHGQEFIICNLSKIFNIDSRKTMYKKNETKLHIIIEC